MTRAAGITLFLGWFFHKEVLDLLLASLRKTSRITGNCSQGLAKHPAWKYKCISHGSLSSSQTVIFGPYQPGPDADWQPEGESLWTPWLIPRATNSPGSFFATALIFIRKFRGISTTNRKGVDISNSIFNYRKISGKVSSPFCTITNCYSSSAWIHTEERRQTQSSLWLFITWKMKETNATAQTTGCYNFVPHTGTSCSIQSSNRNSLGHQKMLDSPLLLLPLLLLVQPDVRFSQFHDAKRSTAYSRVIYVILRSQSSIKICKLPSRISK